jgi:beta-glucosidase
VSPLEGLRAALGDGVRLTFEPGASIGRGPSRLDPTRLDGGALAVEYLDESGAVVQTGRTARSWFRWDPQFQPAGPHAPWTVRASSTFTAAWDGEHAFSVRTAGRLRLWVGDAVAVDSWDASDGRRTVGGTITLAAGETVPLRFEWATANGDLGLDLRVLEPWPGDVQDRAVAAAADADVAVVVVGLDSTWETEGRDRTDLSLPGDQASLVRRVAAANPRTVVVVNAGAPIDLSWIDAVPAVVQLWYPGQEGGHALADVLLGAVNPGGRLPTTFPKRLADLPAMLNYPGERGEVRYGEGLFIGYRAFDRLEVEPAFPFGHGLSYTTFSYGPVGVSSSTTGPGLGLEVTVAVTNTGAVAGDEVVQLYVGDPEATVLRPPKELKGFVRLRDVAPGATVEARFALDDRSFAFWDPAAHDWVVEPGEFEVLVGASATDLRGRATVTWST